ncbi:hypothetical protein ACFSQ7_40560 [Paenibacillus rhizoplanae]
MLLAMLKPTSGKLYMLGEKGRCRKLYIME